MSGKIFFYRILTNKLLKEQILLLKVCSLLMNQIKKIVILLKHFLQFYLDLMRYRFSDSNLGVIKTVFPFFLFSVISKCLVLSKAALGFKPKVVILRVITKSIPSLFILKCR